MTEIEKVEVDGIGFFTHVEIIDGVEAIIYSKKNRRFSEEFLDLSEKPDTVSKTEAVSWLSWLKWALKKKEAHANSHGNVVKKARMISEGKVVVHDSNDCTTFWSDMRANKEWVCEVCGKVIEPGNRYLRKQAEEVQVGHYAYSERTPYCFSCGPWVIKEEIEAAGIHWG